MKVFYSELAAFWPLLSPVEDYEEEAEEVARVIEEALPSARTMLELGSGGGHNAFHLKQRFALTLTDLSREMLDVSAALNPECVHVEGDMRTLALDATFDVVFVHDAIDYMTTREDLALAVDTAYRHCAPGGVALFCPDAVRERFEPGTEAGGSDASDGRGIRYLEWSYDLGPDDTRGVVQYAFVLRERDGSVRTLHETHTFGLFPESTWHETLEARGFDVRVVTERTSEARAPRRFFLGRRPR